MAGDSEIAESTPEKGIHHFGANVSYMDAVQTGAGGVGNSETLAVRLEEIVSHLGLISNTLLSLEQRVSSNETAVAQVLKLHEEYKMSKRRNSEYVYNMA